MAVDAYIFGMPYKDYFALVNRVSNIQSMATARKSKSEGTQILVHTFANNEDAVIPDGEEIVSVEYDRTMAVTRVTTSRPYDSEQAQAERDAAAGPGATPAYPQAAGAVSAPTAPPNTSYPWGSFDHTKAAHVEEAAALANAGSLPEGQQPHNVEGLTGDPAGLPPEAVGEDSKDDAEARASATRSEEQGQKTDTPTEGTKVAEGPNPRVSADQKVEDGEVKA